MRTAAQSEASRRNGACSLGPATPEGKARSSQNAVTHGLSSRKIFLPEGESLDEFLQLQADLVARFRPSDAVELRLVHDMADARWRKSRCFDLENTTLAQGAGHIAEHHTELNYILRYQAQAERSFQRSLESLLVLQKQKMQNEPAPPPPPEPEPEPEPEPDPEPANAALPEPDPAQPRRYYLLRLPPSSRAAAIKKYRFSTPPPPASPANSPRHNALRRNCRPRTASRTTPLAPLSIPSRTLLVYLSHPSRHPFNPRKCTSETRIQR